MMHEKEGWAAFVVIAIGAGFLVYAAAHAVGQVLALEAYSANSSGSPAVDTSGWTDYHSAQFNFDIKYPPGWQLSAASLANTTPFVAIGNPLDGAKTYIVEIFIKDNSSTLSSGEYVHQMLAADKESASQVTPEYKSVSVLRVGQGSYEAYELLGVYEFDHNAEQIYVANGDEILRFDFPVAEENPNISLPVANNAVAHEILGTLVLE
jgi:hypothetical protein